MSYPAHWLCEVSIERRAEPALSRLARGIPIQPCRKRYIDCWLHLDRDEAAAALEEQQQLERVAVGILVANPRLDLIVGLSMGESRSRWLELWYC
jgi:hypothetical protein